MVEFSLIKIIVLFFGTELNITEDGVLFRHKRLKIDQMTGRKVMRSKQKMKRSERINECGLYTE